MCQTIFEDLDTTEPNDSVKSACFLIINNGNPESSNGTGFIINSSGYFLTACHNIHEDVESCTAYYDNGEYLIRMIYKEYDQEGKDFFLGQLKDFDNAPNITFDLLRTDSLTIGDSLHTYGFNQHHYYGESPIIRVNDISYYSHKLNLTLVTLEEKSAFRRLDPRIGNENIKLLNDFSTTKYYGLSGGPVYFENTVCGVLIADMFVPSYYIIETCRENGIDIFD